MDCDIVLLPDNKLAKKVIAASERLGRMGSHFVLEDGRYFPHVSLYMVRLKVENISIVEEALQQLARVSKPEFWAVQQYGFSRGYVVVNYEISQQAISLQEQIIKAINPIRYGTLEKDRSKIKEATGLALKNYQMYGYKYIGELFHPHITLSRFDEDRNDIRELLPEPRGLNGSFVSLGLFELGEDNTCIRKIASFNLASA